MKSRTQDKDKSPVDGWEQFYLHKESADAWKAEPDSFWEQLSDRMDLDSSTYVIDLGCGDGRNVFPWIQKGFSVIAIDSAPTALKQLGARCREAGFSPPVLLEADMCDIPLASEQATAIQCFDALGQVHSPAIALEEVTRLLIPGGWLAFNLYTPNDCAHGKGEKLDRNLYRYKETMFAFFEESEVLGLLNEDLELLRHETKRWEDPPHVPFRPYPHTHEAVYCLCRKKTLR